ncbi:MAG: ABC transporter substrate-binding protein [Deltaproteobacteria bacterium]|nr:ABC transporter substrate-binding protein [Deltaproteobacteria bacterium]
MQVFSVLAAMILAAMPLAGASPAPAGERINTVYSAISGIMAGLWTAEEAGAFARQGLHVELVLIPSASKAVQALLGGDAPIITAGGKAPMEASLAGADLVMVAAVANVPAFYLMARPEIRRIEELRGKPVGVTRFGSSTDFTMRYILRKFGLEPLRDVPILQTGDLFAAAAMLGRGQIVAAPFSSPSNLRAKQLGAHVLVNVPETGVRFPHNAIIVGRGYLRGSRDTLKRFVKAYAEGVQAVFARQEMARRAIARYTKSREPEVIEAVHQYAMDYITKLPYVTREGIQEVLNQIAEENPRARQARPEQFVDDSVVRELEQERFFERLWGRAQP